MPTVWILPDRPLTVFARAFARALFIADLTALQELSLFLSGPLFARALAELCLFILIVMLIMVLIERA